MGALVHLFALVLMAAAYVVVWIFDATFPRHHLPLLLFVLIIEIVYLNIEVMLRDLKDARRAQDLTWPERKKP